MEHPRKLRTIIDKIRIGTVCYFFQGYLFHILEHIVHYIKLHYTTGQNLRIHTYTGTCNIYEERKDFLRILITFTFAC